MTKPKKLPRPKKEDLVLSLLNLMTNDQWEVIHKLIGREIGGVRRDLNRARFLYLCALFHKTSNRHSTSRDAAQDLQKQACNIYASVMGLTPGSSRDDDAEIKPRQSGQAGVDVVLSPRIREELKRIGFPDCCECKNVRDWNLQEAVRQAKANTPEGSSWIVVMKRRARIKRDRIAPIVVMELQTLMAMIEYAYRDLGKEL